jgi:MFS family permease
MGKFSKSWSLVKSSWAVVRSDKKLVLLPIISIMAMLVTGIVSVIGIWNVHPFFTDSTNEFGQSAGKLTLTPVTVGLMVVAYLLVTFIGMFFSAALICGANERLSGGSPTIGSSLAGARKHAGKILVWSAFSATISVAIRQASQRVGLLGKIVVSIIGAVWAVATFFVLPIMIVEGVGVNDAFTRSKALMKKTWGEQVIGGGIVSLVMIPVIGVWMVICFGVISVNAWAGLVLLAIGTLVLIAVSHMLSVVFSTALYKFATTGVVPAGFNADAISNAFTPKKKGLFGRK